MKVMTPTKRLRSAYIYSEVDKYSSRNCGIVVELFGAHTYFGNGLWCSKIWRILAIGSSKPSFESGGLFRDDVGENAEG